MSDSAEQSDPAAIFASALSVWNACHRAAENDSNLNLSDCYQGMDQLMRVVMSIGGRFEAWSCANLAFDALEDVWPYLMEDKFGDTCLQVLSPESLEEFNDDDCLRAALILRLPVKICDGLPVPLDVTATNPIAASPFTSFRIQTVRDHLEEHRCEPFKPGDEPFDEQFGTPYFALSGVGRDGLLEHVANRQTYGEALGLVQRLSPGISFPAIPISSNSCGD